jgi:hypothetical protein
MRYLKEANVMKSGEVYMTHISPNKPIAPKLIDLINKKLELSDNDLGSDDDWGKLHHRMLLNLL